MSRILDTLKIDSGYSERFIATKIAEAGLSVRELQNRTGISKTRISCLKNCEVKLSVDDVQRLGFACGFDPADALRPVTEIETASDHTQEHITKIVTSIMETSLAMVRAMGHKLDVSDIIAWHRANNGRLENCDQFRQFVGFFSCSEGGAPEIEAREIGPSCLAAASLQTPNAEQVNQYVRSLGRASREEISFTYQETRNTGKWKLYERQVLVDFPGAGPKYNLSYLTLLLPVHAGKEKLVMNFSAYLGSEPVE